MIKNTIKALSGLSCIKYFIYNPSSPFRSQLKCCLFKAFPSHPIWPCSQALPLNQHLITTIFLCFLFLEFNIWPPPWKVKSAVAREKTITTKELQEHSSIPVRSSEASREITLDLGLDEIIPNSASLQTVTLLYIFMFSIITAWRRRRAININRNDSRAFFGVYIK